MNIKNVVKGMFFATIFAVVGCQSVPPPPATVWELPPNLGKAKSDIGIQMYGPVTSEGGALAPGLSQQFIEAVESKMIDSKRFHIKLPNAFGEMPESGDADVVIKPFVDIIQQPMRDGNKEGVCNICKVMLDVKIFDKEDGEATEAINLDGVAKVTVPSVFGKPARDVDVKGLIVQAYGEAYKLLEQQLNFKFPPVARVDGSPRVIRPMPSKDPKAPPPQITDSTVKVMTKGGANIGFKPGWDYLLFTTVDGAPLLIARLSIDSGIMEEKAAFKSKEANDTDPEAWDYWSRLCSGESMNLFVAPYFY